MDCSLSGFSVHGILQARIQEWVAIPFSTEFSWPRAPTQVSCIAGRFFTIWATGKDRSPKSHRLSKFTVGLVAQRLKRLPAVRETWVQSLGWEDPLEKEMATHSSILGWRIPGTEEPDGTTVHRVTKSRTRLHFHFHFQGSRRSPFWDTIPPYLWTCEMKKEKLSAPKIQCWNGHRIIVIDILVQWRRKWKEIQVTGPTQFRAPTG